jgi:hypothetical protein
MRDVCIAADLVLDGKQRFSRSLVSHRMHGDVIQRAHDQRYVQLI